MDNNKVNVIVPKDYNGKAIEVVIREGHASKVLDEQPPVKIDITGTIDAPLRWLKQRISLIDQKKANIRVNRSNMKILLTTEETDPLNGGSVMGVLKVSDEIQRFGINTSKKWIPIELSMFLKMNRAFFPDKSQNMQLVSDLKKFKAKIDSQLEQSKEENGSYSERYSQVVDSNLPKSFKIRIPLFRGFQPEDIEIETYADIDGRSVTLSLISAGANETMEEYKNKVIDEQLAEIEAIAPDLVIIEE